MSGTRKRRARDPKHVSTRAIRAFEVLGEELKAVGLRHHIVLYDPSDDFTIQLHTFEDRAQLERVIRHILRRVRSGAHERDRSVIGLDPDGNN